MCEDCPIYEGYPTSVLGWDEDEEGCTRCHDCRRHTPDEELCSSCECCPDCCDCEEQACCDCQNGVVVVERYAQLPTGDLFVMTACGCECHKQAKSEEV